MELLGGPALAYQTGQTMYEPAGPNGRKRDLLLALRPEGMMAYQETFVQRDQHRIYV